MKTISLIFVIFAVFGLLLFSCATTGPGGKKSLILIGTNDEVAIGQNLAKEVESQNKVTQDTILGNYINQIGQKVASLSDRKDIKYHFKVLDSPEINAFACPGGFHLCL